MKRPRANRFRPATYKRASIAVCALLVIALVAYAEVIRPNQDASNYIAMLDRSSDPLESCFTDLAKTTQLGIYYAPDVPLEDKRQDTATILQQINTCQKELATFENKSHGLATLHLSGYTPQYREAKVFQRQASDITGQSNDVMDQYALMATFLSKYYDHIIAYTTYSEELRTNSRYMGSAQLTTLNQQAADLRQRAGQIRTLDAPQEFNDTKQQTADMFDNTATGFENIIQGYHTGNTTLINSGYDRVDAATAIYDSTIVNLPFNQLTKSYIPKQVNQLPGKVRNLLSSSVE